MTEKAGNQKEKYSSSFSIISYKEIYQKLYKNVKEYPSNSTLPPEKFQKDLRTLLENKLTLCPLYGKKPASELLRSVKAPLNDLDQNPPGPGEVFSWIERSLVKGKLLNFGIRTGETSDPYGEGGGLLGLDWDVKFRGKYLDLPETSRVITNSGFHEYYYYENPAELVSRSGKDQPLDTKGDGCYLVAPPSIHPDSGKPYRWEDDKNNPLAFGEPAELSKFQVEKINEFTRDLKKTQNTTSEQVSKPEPDKETRPVKAGEDWKELAGDPDVAESLMEKIIELSKVEVSKVEVGNSFKCPLPGYEDSDQTGAALYKPDPVEVDGEPYYRLHDFHDRGERDYWSLPEVYASVVTGELQDFTGGEYDPERDIITDAPRTGTARIWWLRLLNETGVIETPVRTAPKLPKDVKDSVKDVYESFKYLLELRSFHDPEQEGSPFSWRFAEAWTGLGRGTVQRAVKSLMERGYIVVKEKRGEFETNILELGTPDQVEKAKERIEAQEKTES